MRSFNVDLCDFDAMTRALTQIRPSAIVHLAGIAAPTHSNIGEMYSANVVGTANLFAALGIAKIDPRIVIVASSAQVYAVPDPERPLTEDGALAPKTHYAVSKRATEEIARNLFAPIPDYHHAAIQLHRPRTDDELSGAKNCPTLRGAAQAKLGSAT